MALSDGRAAGNFGTQSGKIGICVPAGRRLSAGQRELLICTAAKGEKKKCGRATLLPDTAAIGKKTELRPCELLIYTAANSEKAECGRTTRLNDTAAIGKRQSCGRTTFLADTAAIRK